MLFGSHCVNILSRSKCPQKLVCYTSQTLSPVLSLCSHKSELWLSLYTLSKIHGYFSPDNKLYLMPFHSYHMGALWVMILHLVAAETLEPRFGWHLTMDAAGSHDLIRTINCPRMHFHQVALTVESCCSGDGERLSQPELNKHQKSMIWPEVHATAQK